MEVLQTLFHGNLGVKYCDGYLVPMRFTDAQISAVSDNESFVARTKCAASVTLEFITDAESLSFDYKFFLRTGVKSTFEVFANGFLTNMVKDSEIDDEGRLTFRFEPGEKYIEIYIPNYSEVGIKNLTSDAELKRITKERERILFIGDSITQGGGSKRSGMTYVNVIKRELDLEVLNWGIGGYPFDERIVEKSSFIPDKIVVAMGTNNRFLPKEKNEQAIGAFFEKLNNLYPNIPILTVIPPWSGEADEIVALGLKQVKEIIETTSRKYPQIKTINAYYIVPHFTEYYMDDLIHPNGLGMAVYGINLAKKLKEL